MAARSDTKSPDWWTRIVSVSALVISLASASAAWWAQITVTKKAAAEQERSVKDDLYRTMVYDILTQGMKEKEKWHGLTLDEIEDRCKQAVAKGEFAEVKLDPADIKRAHLKKYLLDLIGQNLVVRTTDDRYAADAIAVNPYWMRAGNDLLLDKVVTDVLLENDGEPYTLETFREAIGKRVPLTTQDFRGVIVELQRSGMVRVVDGKICLPGSLPKKGGHRKD
jgi:hypothetical protein